MMANAGALCVRTALAVIVITTLCRVRAAFESHGEWQWQCGSSGGVSLTPVLTVRKWACVGWD